MTQLRFIRSKDPLLKACVQNRYDYFSTFGAGENGKRFNSHQIKWVYTGSPFFNLIYGANWAVEETEANMFEVLCCFDQWNVPVSWVIDPLTKPLQLESILEKNGFTRSFGSYGMVKELTSIQHMDSNGLDFTIREVQSTQLYESWSSLICDVFQIQPQYKEILIRSSQSAPTDYKHFLGFYQEVPVTAVSVLFSQGVAGIYWVATKPAMQRKGFASSLLNHVLCLAKDWGYQHATLQSTGIGHAFYKRLGFIDLYAEKGFERKF